PAGPALAGHLRRPARAGREWRARRRQHGYGQHDARLPARGRAAPTGQRTRPTAIAHAWRSPSGRIDANQRDLRGQGDTARASLRGTGGVRHRQGWPQALRWATFPGLGGMSQDKAGPATNDQAAGELRTATLTVTEAAI